MLRKLLKLLPAAVLGACPMIQAHAASWAFTYQGFYRPELGYFDDTYVLAGSFDAVDQDGNGTIALAELIDLRVAGQSYFTCAPRSTCGVETFSYAPGGGLSFLVYDHGNDGAGASWSNSITTGVSINSYWTNGQTNFISEALWTEQTQFSISPVPEPATAMMLAAGLLLGSGLRRFAPPAVPRGRP